MSFEIYASGKNNMFEIEASWKNSFVNEMLLLLKIEFKEFRPMCDDKQTPPTAVVFYTSTLYLVLRAFSLVKYNSVSVTSFPKPGYKPFCQRMLKLSHETLELN